ncbi:hypothetical protein JCM11641_002750 [Rhodosporidiobolus odoratus]
MPKGRNWLDELPLELLSLIAGCLPLPSLLSLSLASRFLHDFLSCPASASIWRAAVEVLDMPELEEPLRPQQLAWLGVGGKGREGWVVFEGPDEPDPAFEEFFPGTKRYTPRNPFFFHAALSATSDFLSTLLASQITRFEQASETDPLAELDDFLTFSALPEDIKNKLEERLEWVGRVWRDGGRLAEWGKRRKEEEREEKKAAQKRWREEQELTSSGSGARP